MIKTLGTLLAGICLITTLNSCYLNNQIRHNIKLKEYKPITETTKNDTLYAKLNESLKDNLRKIYVLEEKDFFKEIAGHFHRHKGFICLDKNFDDEILFHEVGHVKHFDLNKKKSKFSKEWKKIASSKYKKKLRKDYWTWNDGLKGPKNGMLNPYSSKNIYEDVASFVQCLGYDTSPEVIMEPYKQIKEFNKKKENLLKKESLSPGESVRLNIYNMGLIVNNLIINLNPLNELVYFYPLYFADTTDSRYQQKLNLLKKYRFFTEKEHGTLSEGLGSLYGLKKK